MDIMVLIIELAVLTVLFTLEIVIPLTKNPASFITDYPPEIQEVYYRTHEEEKETLTKFAVIRKIGALIIVLFAFIWMAHLAGAYSFISASLISFLYIVWIAAFDTFILDWIFFPRVKKWRLPGTEHMDKEYAQKWFHLKEVLKVAPLGIVYALLCGAVFIFVY